LLKAAVMSPMVAAAVPARMGAMAAQSPSAASRAVCLDKLRRMRPESVPWKAGERARSSRFATNGMPLLADQRA
jgi:hypothetical protein